MPLAPPWYRQPEVVGYLAGTAFSAFTMLFGVPWWIALAPLIVAFVILGGLWLAVFIVIR